MRTLAIIGGIELGGLVAFSSCFLHVLQPFAWCYVASGRLLGAGAVAVSQGIRR